MTDLEDALCLWRGPALADFSYEAFAVRRSADWKSYRDRSGRRIDVDLRGRHAGLVGELEHVCAPRFASGSGRI